MSNSLFIPSPLLLSFWNKYRRTQLNNSVCTCEPGFIRNRRNCTDAASSFFFVFDALVTKMGLLLVFQQFWRQKWNVAKLYSILTISHLNSVMTSGMAFYRQYRNYLFLSFSFFLWLDIDECKTNLSSCHVNADCLNTIGSYVCRCHTGYIGDGKNCSGN